jgi:transcriptional regulator with XRE-family HTH domain
MSEHASAPDAEQPESIGKRIHRLREEKRMTLSGLAAKAEISKGYLWSMESGSADSRPSATTLYNIAKALGVTMADLLDRPGLVVNVTEVPQELRDFASEDRLPETDVQMLAGIQFRGEHPRSVERWRFIYNAIRHSGGLDPRPDASHRSDAE